MVLYSSMDCCSPRSPKSSSSSTKEPFNLPRTNTVYPIIADFKTHFTIVHGVKQRSLHGLSRQQWHCTMFMQSKKHMPTVTHFILQQKRRLISKLLYNKLKRDNTPTIGSKMVICTSSLLSILIGYKINEIWPIMSTVHIESAPSSRYLQK